MRILRLLITLLLVLVFVPVVSADHDPPRGIPRSSESATVREIVDGDTFRVTLEDGTRDTVRLIGIDTPEVHSGAECCGPDAPAQLARLLRIGREVWLETDESNRDRYDRLLRYVWVEKNDVHGQRGDGAGRVRRGGALRAGHRAGRAAGEGGAGGAEAGRGHLERLPGCVTSVTRSGERQPVSRPPGWQGLSLEVPRIGLWRTPVVP